MRILHSFYRFSRKRFLSVRHAYELRNNKKFSKRKKNLRVFSLLFFFFFFNFLSSTKELRSYINKDVCTWMHVVRKKKKKGSQFLSLWKIAERIEHHQWKIVECVTSYTLDGKLQWGKFQSHTIKSWVNWHFIATILLLLKKKESLNFE